MMSKLDEEDFIISCMNQLKTYSEHNNEEIDYVLGVLKYRKKQLEQAVVAKHKSLNEERH